MKLYALDYAKLGCDTLMKKFVPAELPPTNLFHYHQGVFLSGMERVYELCGDEKYYKYIKEWVDLFIDENGTLHHAHTNQFDDLQPATLLFNIYEKTEDYRYKKVLDTILPLYKSWPLNAEGGFWHKEEFPNQMWLDLMYMSGPLAVLYGKYFKKEKYFDIIYKQMSLMWEHMRDKNTGLMYHAWDCSKEADWADKNTGLSPEFWGRALGWYVVALLDIAEYLPDSYIHKNKFIQNGTELIKSIAKYQDGQTKKWFQVVDKGEDINNWTETSCSCLFVYALAKALRMGYIDDSYISTIRNGYEAIINDVEVAEGIIVLSDICIGTGVCDYEKYLARPTRQNDLHGMGAFVLMCTEYSRLKDIN